jgi:hypothetical protein
MDGRDHGHGAFGGDGLSEAVPVGGGIGQADLGRPALDQASACGCSRSPARGRRSKRGLKRGSEDQAIGRSRAGLSTQIHRAVRGPRLPGALGPHGRSEGRRMVEATIRDAKSGSSDLAAKRAARCLRLHRLKRRKTLFRRAPPAHHARASPHDPRRPRRPSCCRARSSPSGQAGR